MSSCLYTDTDVWSKSTKYTCSIDDSALFSKCSWMARRMTAAAVCFGKELAPEPMEGKAIDFRPRFSTYRKHQREYEIH